MQNINTCSPWSIELQPRGYNFLFLYVQRGATIAGHSTWITLLKHHRVPWSGIEPLNLDLI